MKREWLRLLALHFVGNALLLLLGYYWLGVGESNGLHLLWSCVLFVSFVVGALWLHGSAFTYFGEAKWNLARAIGITWRHLPALLVLATVAAALYSAASWLFSNLEHTAFLIASFTTLKTRRPLAPDRVLAVFHVALWLLRWFLFPIALFTMAAKIAPKGWSGFHWQRRPLRHYFARGVIICLLLVIGLVLPLKLLAWVPAFPQFGLQMMSLLLRMGAGYLLFVVALLGVEFLIATGRPLRSQPNTVASP